MTQIDDRTAPAEAVLDATALDDEDVAAYLRANPDFLNRNPDVLEVLAPPARWSGDGVVDMQQYLINRNRSEMDELRDCAQDVIETSRSNMSIQTRAHAAVLALLAAREWTDMIHVVTQDWPLLLDVDVIVLGFEPPAASDPRLSDSGLADLPAGTIDRLLGPDQDVRLAREMNDDGTLFGSGAGLVRSAALVRMRPAAVLPHGLPMGVLALGARGATFHPGQGTEVLSFLCRVLESATARCFDADGTAARAFGD
ncbi:MAG: DUF484 family protein [Rhodospirillaceae bacterium]